MRHGKWVATGVAGALLSVVAPAGAIVSQSAGYEAWALRNADAARFQSVGTIRTFNNDGGPVASASGVLIAPDWVLTTAHVLEEAAEVVFSVGEITETPVFPHPLDPTQSGNLAVGYEHVALGDTWYTHARYSGNILAGYDLALVKLTSPIEGIRTARLAGIQAPYEIGKEVAIAGRGRFGVGNGAKAWDYTFTDGSNGGRLRAGTNVIDGTLDNFFGAYRGENGPVPIDSRISYFDFDGARQPGFNPVADDGVFDKNDFPTRFEVNTAVGDSGGGVFLGDTLVGLISGGFDPDSDLGDVSFATRIRPYYRWLKRVMRYVDRGGVAFGFNKNFRRWGIPIVTDDGIEIYDLEVEPDVDDDGGAQRRAFYGPVAVPEPTTLVLLGGAGLAMLARPRRRA